MLDNRRLTPRFRDRAMKTLRCLSARNHNPSLTSSAPSPIMTASARGCTVLKFHWSSKNFGETKIPSAKTPQVPTFPSASPSAFHVPLLPCEQDTTTPQGFSINRASRSDDEPPCPFATILHIQSTWGTMTIYAAERVGRFAQLRVKRGRDGKKGGCRRRSEHGWRL